MLYTKQKILVLLLMIFKSSPSYGVVHLDGKYARVQVVGASTPGETGAEQPIVIQNAALQPSPIGGYAAEAKARVDERIKRLEKLVKNLSSSVEQTEYARKIEHASQIEKIRQEILMQQDRQHELTGQLAERLDLEKVTRQRLQNKGLLEGLVHVAQDELIDVRFGENAVTLSLEGNARVAYADVPVVLRSGDTIIVRGKNNELVVSKSMVCEGAIIFAEENAELTISLAPRAQLTMRQTNGALTLSSDAVFKCRGSGYLTFASNCGIAFNQKPSGARVVLTDGLQVNMTGSILACSGIGSLVFDKSANLVLNDEQRCVIGLNSQDYINFVVRGGAGISMTSQTFGSQVIGSRSGLTFNNGAYDLSVIEKGFINVGPGAALSLQNPDEELGAICKKLMVTRGGHICVAPQGLLVVKKQLATCNIDIEESAIEAGGYVSFAGLQSLALMQRHGAIKRTCSLGGLVRALINKKQSFNWATVFEDATKQSWLFLPEQGVAQQLDRGLFIKLDENAMVTTENVDARKVSGVVRGNLIEFSDNGVTYNVPRTRGIFLNYKENELGGLRSFFVAEECNS